MNTRGSCKNNTSLYFNARPPIDVIKLCCDAIQEVYFFPTDLVGRMFTNLPFSDGRDNLLS